MSTRLYRIKEIKTADYATTKMGSEVANYIDTYDEEGNILEASVQSIREILDGTAGIDLNEYERAGLEKDLKVAEKNGDEYIQYMVY